MAMHKDMPEGSLPKFKVPEEIRALADAYFRECEGEVLFDHNGDPILDRWGNPTCIGKRPPTIVGLALALGFKTRRAFLKFQDRNKKFEDVILEARSRVEKYCEERLFDKDGTNGARFSLQVNFGWREERQEEQQAGPVVTIINDIPQAGLQEEQTETVSFSPLRKPVESG